jgi:hypothetical protein
VGPGTDLDTVVVKKKITRLFQDFNPCCPARSIVAILTELLRFLRCVFSHEKLNTCVQGTTHPGDLPWHLHGLPGVFFYLLTNM